MVSLIKIAENFKDRVLARFNKTEQAMLSMDGKTLQECTDGDLKSMLSYCCIMVGIHRVPSDDVKMVIVGYLRKYHGGMTNKQVAQAFELAATGMYGTACPEHYQNISPQYISEVLTCFTMKVKTVVDKAKRAEFQMQIEQAPKSTPEQYYAGLLKAIDKHQFIPMIWAWEEVCEHLMEIADININYEPTPDQAKELVIAWCRKKYPTLPLQSSSFDSRFKTTRKTQQA